MIRSGQWRNVRYGHPRRLACELLDGRCLLAGDFFTLVAIPDTQFYSESRPDILHDQTQWIVDSISSRNIAFVSHLGDLVNSSASDLQWQNIDAAMDRLDGDLLLQPDGLVPYSTAAGNHDFEPVDKHLGAPHYIQYFGRERFENRSWYGGSSLSQLNHYQRFNAHGLDLLHITVEWEPRPESIAWAQEILNAHPNTPAILTTHAYLTAGEHSTDPRTSDGVAGDEIFAQLVAPNPQIFLVLNGHFSGESHRVNYNQAGLEVIEMQVDYQSRANGGDGWLRYLEFHPAENRIDSYTYSPTLGQLENDANSQFSLSLDFANRFQSLAAPFAYVAAPLDNGASDVNPRSRVVQTNTLQPHLAVQLRDAAGGINDATVTSAIVALSKDGILLEHGIDYTFSYDDLNDQILLFPVRSLFENGIYEIALNSDSAAVLDGVGQVMAPAIFTIDINTSLPSTPSAFYFAMSGSLTLPSGVPLADEDIHYFDGTNFTWMFDGSDVGLASAAIDALHFVGANELLLSFKDPVTLPGIAETVDDSDIVRFLASSLGSDTAGAFEMYLDGSDVGLTSGGEDINALEVLADGSLVLSTSGSFSVGALAGSQEDLIRFVPSSLGNSTAGAFSLYFDGAAVQLGGSIDGFALYGPDDIYMSLTSDFTYNGPTIRDDDVFVVSTAGVGQGDNYLVKPHLFFDGSAKKLGSGDLLDIQIPVVRPPGNHAPDARVDELLLDAGTAASLLMNGEASLLWNDIDIDLPADQLSINATLVRPPQYGTVSVNSDGTFRYVHDGSNQVRDLFYYELVDASGASDTAAVIVNIITNSAPQLSDLPDIELQQGSAGGSIDLDSFFSDVETAAEDATFEIASPINGIALTIDPVTHVLSIVPEDGFYGEVDALIRATDTGDGESPPRSAASTLHIRVQPIAEPQLFVTLYSGIKSQSGVSLANEDILSLQANDFVQLLDGSDLGLSAARINDFAVISGTEILLVFSGNVLLPGTNITADTRDVVKFTATALGTTTAGTFSIYFDGDDVGLDTTSENLDGIELLLDGTLLLSTKSSFTVPGLTGRDEDILAFTATSLGESTAGSWSFYFDGSDVGLSSYDIDAFAVDEQGHLLLSTDGSVTIPGLTVADEDVFRFIATSLGPVTAGTYDPVLVLDGSQYGLSSNEVAGVDWVVIVFPFPSEGEGEGESRRMQQPEPSPAHVAASYSRLSPAAVDLLMARAARKPVTVEFDRDG